MPLLSQYGRNKPIIPVSVRALRGELLDCVLQSEFLGPKLVLNGFIFGPHNPFDPLFLAPLPGNPKLLPRVPLLPEGGSAVDR